MPSVIKPLKRHKKTAQRGKPMPQSKRWSKVEVRQTMMNEKKFAEAIAELMIDSLDPENPDPQSNGYNWGLVDAERVLRGVPLDVIKESRAR